MKQSETYRAAEALVRSLGVTCVNLSVRQLICGLLLLHNDDTLVHDVTKRLYPMIAERYPTSGVSSVERNLRSARDAIVDRGDRERLEEVIGHKLRYSLSVADLLDSMDYYLRRNGLWPD